MEISIGRENSLAHFDPVIVKNFKQLENIILKRSYSLSTFKNGYRNKENFIQASCIGLDFDGGMTLEQAKTRFAKYRHLIATTRSHQKEKNGVVCDRFRVVLWLKYPILTNETFEATWFELSKEFPEADRACKDGSRFFFPSVEVISRNKDGALIELVEPKKEEKSPTKEVGETEKVKDEKGMLARDTLNFLVLGAPDGKKHHSLYKAARDAFQQGYSKEWYLEQVESLVKRTGDPAYTDAGALKTIEDAFFKDPKHEPRIQKSAFNLSPISQIYESKEEIEWLVADLLAVGSTSLMSADPKAGKSTLVRQLIRDVVKGGFFLDRKCKKGKVFYFAIEEHVTVVKSSFKRLGVTEADELFVHVGDPLTDNKAEDFRDIILNEKPALVVIDTLFDLIDVESENNYKEVKRELRKIRQLARESGSHILMVHHNSKGTKEDTRRGNRGILGSQAIAGGVDSIMVIELEGKDRIITTTGREIERWFNQVLAWDHGQRTYSLTKEVRF